MSSRGKLRRQSRDGGKRIYVVFRMDDYSAASDTGLELRILDLFEKKKVGITFGVVPFVCAGDQRNPAAQGFIPLPREKAELLRAKLSAGFLDIALHGYSHQTNDVTGDPSEFAGLDYAVQAEKLKEGKRFLEEVTGHPVECFIPPWNSYDLNTVRALEEVEFEILSAGWKGVAAGESKIRFLPATCHLDAMQDAIVAARNSSDQQPVVVVLFHHYEFKEFMDPRGRMTLEELSALLDRLKERKDLQLVSIAKADQAINDLSAKRFLTLERWREVERFLPKALREKKPILLYHEVCIYSKTRNKIVSLYIFASVIIFYIFLRYV